MDGRLRPSGSLLPHLQSGPAGTEIRPDGSYVRHWVPELAGLPLEYLTQPHSEPPDVLAAANVRLGENYPRPIVSHADSRAAALTAFRSLRG